MDQVFLGRRNGPGRDRVGWCERMLTFPLSQRNLPSRGFSPAALLIGAGAVMAYGWYKLAVGIREQNELGREKMWSRIHLIPLLQAEEDRDQVRRHLADQAREKELMGGENFKVYNSERFVRPTFAVTPKDVTK